MSEIISSKDLGNDEIGLGRSKEGIAIFSSLKLGFSSEKWNFQIENALNQLEKTVFLAEKA